MIDLREVNAILSDGGDEDGVVMVSRRWLRAMRDEIARGRLSRNGRSKRARASDAA